MQNTLDFDQFKESLHQQYVSCEDIQQVCEHIYVVYSTGGKIQPRMYPPETIFGLPQIVDHMATGLPLDHVDVGCFLIGGLETTNPLGEDSNGFLHAVSKGDFTKNPGTIVCCAARQWPDGRVHMELNTYTSSGIMEEASGWEVPDDWEKQQILELVGVF